MRAVTHPNGVEVHGAITGRASEILTPAALEFLAALQRRFNPHRQRLLLRRADRQARFDRGELPTFLEETRAVREGDWKVSPAPEDLGDRRVEITGPVERKMMINAFNSGAKVFMADFEDALSPTWTNLVEGQANLMDAVRRRLEFTTPDGRAYRLAETIATLVVRPRGWHLDEKHVHVDGHPMPGSLFDFGLFMFHNAAELVQRGSGPYFYLPKMESHLEARLWNEVIDAAEETLGIPPGRTKATVLIETLPAAFEMDEILYELRTHIVGLNAGRWDYIFSLIKKLRGHARFTLPDRAQVTMAVPFMRAYTQLLVRTCHRRGAHAIGGMAAFVPNRRDAGVNRVALAKVREDKLREVGDGCDGTWVAHPDLVPVAKEVFDGALARRPNQLDKARDDVHVTESQLLDVTIHGGAITEAGLRNNIAVGIQYIESWLRGTGAVALHNLMEDAATSEIARAQVWQWIRHAARLDDGRSVTRELVQTLIGDELRRLKEELGEATWAAGRFPEARAVFEQVALRPDFVEFLTLPAYERID